MEEFSDVPEGKTVRYRCGVPRCHSPTKTFSLLTIIEHLASHFRHSIGSRNHANYLCKNCGHSFYLLCMTMSCFCRQYGGENECVSIRKDWNRVVAREDVAFLWYVVRYAVPVLVEKAANRGGERNLSSTPQRKTEGNLGFNTPLMRSPSTYNDGTPRTPLDHDEEEIEPAHGCALRNMSICASVSAVQVKGEETKKQRWGREGPYQTNYVPPSTYALAGQFCGSPSTTDGCRLSAPIVASSITTITVYGNPKIVDTAHGPIFEYDVIGNATKSNSQCSSTETKGVQTSHDIVGNDPSPFGIAFCF
ncbi:unnamed protein product [Angiostrongylus costaricensis]|uniref:C2H2-type domain-containing protein n=1 Tax=Angiostrongylus costaricensis TaxID=334426 RepID=A0A158PJ07_ANGCS|nr:unnamed protein product [Angiostrongylus costaricensis]